MRSSTLIAFVACVAARVFAYLEDPPTTAAPDTIQDCSWWHVAEAGDECTAIADVWSISVSDFTLVYVSTTIRAIHGFYSEKDMFGTWLTIRRIHRLVLAARSSPAIHIAWNVTSGYL